MASAAKRRRKQKRMATSKSPESSHPAEATQAPEPARLAEADCPTQTSTRSRNRVVGTSIVLMVILLGLFFLPTIIAKTPLLGMIVQSATSRCDGQVTVESASLGWFSSPVISGIKVLDANDQPLLEIPCVRGNRSLVDLIRDHSNLGRFLLERPTLNLVLRDDGSNLEDFLAEFLESDDSSSTSTTPEVQIEIVDGHVSLTDEPLAAVWQIEPFQLTANISGQEPQPVEVKVSGVLPGNQPGDFDASVRLNLSSLTTLPENAAAEVDNEFHLITHAFPLEMLRPLGARFSPQTKLAGRLTTNLQGRFRGGLVPTQAFLEGNLDARQLLLATPVLGTDRVVFQQLQSDCKIVWQDGRVDIQRLTTVSDLGNFSAVGGVALADIRAGELLALLPNQTFELNGQVDLALLAAMLPNTLRVQQATQIQSGLLQANLMSRPGPNGMTWSGKIEARDLMAERDGQRIAWQQPVTITLSAHEGPDGPVVEVLECQSDHLRLHASGTPDKLSAIAEFDLNLLAGQIGQFVDLGGIELAGGGGAKFDWKRAADATFQATGQLNVNRFHLVVPNRPAWVEERLVANFSAAGKTDLTPSATSLQTASLNIEAGADRVDARLMQSVQKLDLQGPWPISITSQGEIARWLPRIGPWVTLDGWAFAGNYHLQAQVLGSTSAVRVSQGRVRVRQLDVRGAGLIVREPDLECTLDANWDQKAARLDVANATLECPSLSARAENVAWAMPNEGSSQLSGAIAYQGDLQRMQAWTIQPSAPPAWSVSGRLIGSGQFEQKEGITYARLDNTVDHLVAMHTSGQQIREPKVHLVGLAKYDASSQQLYVDKATLSSKMFSAAANGQYAAGIDPAQLQMDGKVDYSMEQVSRLVRSYLGKGVHLAGVGSSPVSYRGPFSLPDAQAGATFGWDKADLYGFLIGPGQLEATLDQGTVHMKPLDLDASEGRLHLNAEVKLMTDPYKVVIPPGLMVEQVRINPKMCDYALQYIAPAFAGVASADGRFSIEMDACRIPLDDPGKGRLNGRMTVHSVEIGPGSLIRELAVLLGYASPAKLTRESVIPFEMVNRRVHHRDLELVFPDVTIRTSGSVGLDKTMDIIVEMPVPKKWIGNNTLGAALRDQTIRIPVAGTLSKPKLNRNVTDKLMRKFLRTAATNSLKDQLLNRGLDQKILSGGLDQKILSGGLDQLLQRPK